MNEIIERKKQRKKQLEKDLTIIYKFQDFCKGKFRPVEEVETHMERSLEELSKIFKRYNLSYSTTQMKNAIVVSFHNDFVQMAEGLDKELRDLIDEIAGKSFIRKWGVKDLIIGVIIAVVAFLLGRIS